MQENDLYAALWRGANQNDWNLFRISDGSVGKKPFDITGCTPTGIAVGLEVKLIRGRKLLSVTKQVPMWKHYEAHQITWLKKYAEANALALAVEYDETDKGMRAYVLTKSTQFSLECSYVPTVMMLRQTNRMYPAEHTWDGWNEILSIYHHAQGRIREGLP